MNRSVRPRPARGQISSEELTYIQAGLFVIASILFFIGSAVGFTVAARNVRTKKNSSGADDML